MRNFKFRDLILQYYFELATTRNLAKFKDVSEETINQRCLLNLSWFDRIKKDLFELNEICTISRNKRDLNKKKFLLLEKNRCPGCEDGKPFEIIRYRNVDIPVYCDDYGQQDFAFVDGEEISGGSYNFLAEYEFMHCLDYKLQKKFLEGTYDMHKEITKLYPEWQEGKK